jgi:predicted SprT family Zn-dependent metalloprotease
MDRTIQTTDGDNLPTPTAGTYSTFNEAFAHFNEVLFGAELPDVLITMQRSRRSRGYFSAQRFAHRRRTEIIDEIALNPAAMQDRSDRDIASTLAHEMSHLWQQHFGKPSRGGYHNKEWAAKMHEIGLSPSDTGKPGGKCTGQQVSHYIVDGGPFDQAWANLAQAGFKFDYHDRPTNDPEAVCKRKVRYACAVCSIHVWGKPDLRIICHDCNEPMRDGRMPTPEQAEALLRERVAAEGNASGADAVRVDCIARQLEEIEQQRLDDCRIELFEQDNK